MQFERNGNTGDRVPREETRGHGEQDSGHGERAADAAQRESPVTRGRVKKEAPGDSSAQ